METFVENCPDEQMFCRFAYSLFALTFIHFLNSFFSKLKSASLYIIESLNIKILTQGTVITKHYSKIVFSSSSHIKTLKIFKLAFLLNITDCTIQ